MLKSSFLRQIVAGLLLVPYATVLAQEVSPLRALVDGSSIPNKLRPQDLTEEYWPVNLTLSGGGGFDYLSIGMRFAMMGASGSDAAQMGLFKAVQVSWTKGQVVRIGDASFLATYKIDFDPETLGPEAKGERFLSLVLVKPDAITSIGAVPGYTKEQFQRALGVAKEGPASDPAVDKTRTLSNMKQLALGIHIYAADYDDEIPYVQSVKSLQGVVAPYLKNNELWKTYNPSGGRILMNMSLAGVNIASIEQPAVTPMLYEEREWPDGSRLVAYADGHVSSAPRQEWQSLQPMLRLRLKRSKRPLPADWMVQPEPTHAPEIR